MDFIQKYTELKFLISYHADDITGSPAVVDFNHVS